MSSTSVVLVSQPDFHALQALVLDAVSSPVTRQMYAKALNDCFGWWAEQGRPPFQRAVVHAHRNWLEAKGYSPSTINERLAAIRKLAEEAAANGWLAQEIAVGITTIPASSNKEPGQGTGSPKRKRSNSCSRRIQRHVRANAIAS